MCISNCVYLLLLFCMYAFFMYFSIFMVFIYFLVAMFYPSISYFILACYGHVQGDYLLISD